jgi:BlaI family transcriptional regulator, penicillinase repressor
MRHLGGETRKDRLTELGELQVEMLDRLQEAGEATIHDLLDRFAAERRPRLSTAQTVVRSLERRGLATHRIEGRTFVYRVTEQAAEVRRRALRDVLRSLFGGSSRALVSTLLDVGDFTPEELADLKAMVAEREARDDAE